MENKELEYGTIVYYDNHIRGYGKIVGVFNNGTYFLGIGYIIEPIESIKTEHYQYTHIVMFDLYFNKRKSKIANIFGIYS